jgi:hypothetical protein
MQLAIAEFSEYNKPGYSAIAANFPPVNQQTLKKTIPLGEYMSKVFAKSERR